eukprot:SAG11_NODE_1221_length_5486_cov_7.177650_5_plen_134_part_00
MTGVCFVWDLGGATATGIGSGSWDDSDLEPVATWAPFREEPPEAATWYGALWPVTRGELWAPISGREVRNIGARREPQKAPNATDSVRVSTQTCAPPPYHVLFRAPHEGHGSQSTPKRESENVSSAMHATPLA